MKKAIHLIYLALYGFLLSSCAQSGSEQRFVNENVEFACRQTSCMLDLLGAPDGRYPRTVGDDGKLVTTDIYGWTSGFFPGSLWLLYELTGDEKWRREADAWTAPLEPNKLNVNDHDVGFMVYSSFGRGYKLTKNEHYKEVVVQTANSLMTRFSPVIGSLKSWQGGKAPHDSAVWQFPVIIDNMMNLELLMGAFSITGDSAYRKVAVAHAGTTIKNHVREDYSCYHVVDYDTVSGKVRDRATAQGYADNSAWARGQAWGVYGFTMMYRETGMRKFLDVAEGMAGFFLNNPSLPDDGIPLWDFNAGQTGYHKDWKFDETALGYIPRDASAAAILSSALFELYTFTHNEAYFDSARRMLYALASGSYRAEEGTNSGFLLKHSTGSLPHGKEIDVPLVYADYYFLEALCRYERLLDGISLQ